MIVVEEYSIQWKKRPNLTELARLRWIKKLTIAEIAQHFNLAPSTISKYLEQIAASPKKHNLQLTQTEWAIVLPFIRG